MRGMTIVGLACLLVTGCSATGTITADSGLATVFGKDRAAYEQVLGPGTNSQRDEYNPGKTSFSYKWKGLDISLGIDDKSSQVRTLTLFKAGSTWQAALTVLQLDFAKVKAEDKGNGVVNLSGIPGTSYANYYPHGGGTLTIWMPKAVAVVAVPPVSSGLSKTLTAGLRSVIGLKSDAAIVQAMKKLSNGEADGWKFGMRDEGFSDLSFSIGNGGSEKLLSSELGKLPVGILYVGRGDKGKGPAFLKLTFLQNSTPDGALELVAAITGTPKASLKYGNLGKRTDRGHVRRIEGSKYVIDAVGWSGDPKTKTNQLIIGIRGESYETITIS